jgi:hypothetical protein
MRQHRRYQRGAVRRYRDDGERGRTLARQAGDFSHLGGDGIKCSTGLKRPWTDGPTHRNRGGRLAVGNPCVVQRIQECVAHHVSVYRRSHHGRYPEYACGQHQKPQGGRGCGHRDNSAQQVSHAQHDGIKVCALTRFGPGLQQRSGLSRRLSPNRRTPHPHRRRNRISPCARPEVGYQRDPSAPRIVLEGHTITQRGPPPSCRRNRVTQTPRLPAGSHRYPLPLAMRSRWICLCGRVIAVQASRRHARLTATSVLFQQCSVFRGAVPTSGRAGNPKAAASIRRLRCECC